MKKILLITYYFPPCGGAAVQRWVRFLPLLADIGHDITVLTTKHGDYPVLDESLVKKIPNSIKIVRTYTPVFGRFWRMFSGKKKDVPYGSLDTDNSSSVFEKIMLWARVNLIIPDARIIWNVIAVKIAHRLCHAHNYDVVITTGLLHSTHLIGMYLKKRHDVKWIADFRDPWTGIYYLRNKLQLNLSSSFNASLENKVVSRADVVLVVSDFISKQLPKGNKIVLYNGFNSMDFKVSGYKTADKFRIKYIGQITAGQDISSVLCFFSEKIDPDTLANMEFYFIGTRNVKLKEYGFPVTIRDFVPHDKSISEMVNCELLILLINDYADNRGMVTTKLFEYLASGTPIVCLGPLDGEAAKIVLETKSGKVFNKFGPDLLQYVNELYCDWYSGNPIRCDSDKQHWSVQQQVIALNSVIS